MISPLPRNKRAKNPRGEDIDVEAEEAAREAAAAKSGKNNGEGNDDAGKQEFGNDALANLEMNK
jgi:hypothetical protein